MRHVLNLVCCFICVLVQAQNETENFNHYTTRQGLSNDQVHCIIQDSRKFLWIGTREGLNRYDGHSFKKFFSQKNNPNGLSHNYIYSLLEYKPGQLLIATVSGLSVLNTLTGQFENEKISFDPLKAGSGINVTGLYKDPAGQIWISHSGELDILDSNLHYAYRFTDLPWAKDLKGIVIYNNDWYTDKQHRLWIAGDIMEIIDFSAKQVWNYKNNPKYFGFLTSNSFIRSFFLDEDNNVLWYTPWGEGLSRYDLLTHKEQHVLLAAAPRTEFASVNSIIRKNKDRLICGSGAGIYEVDIHSLDYKKVVDKISINPICSDGIHYWAGTNIEGFLQIKETPSFLKELLLTNTNVFDSLSFCTDLINGSNGNIYSSFLSNTLFEIDKERNTYHTFSIPGLKGININEICSDKEGRYWVGTSEGIYLFDAVSKKFYRPPFLPAELRGGITINVIFCDSQDNVWIGTRKPFQLYKYDAVRKRIDKISNDIITAFSSMFVDSRISNIIEDRENLWMISYRGGGIINFNKKTAQWKLYPISNRNKNLLSKDGILSLHPDVHNNLWLTDDFGNGLISYNYLTDSIKRFTRNDGLPSDYISTIVADRSNNLWITSEFGLTQFNIENYKTTSYTLEVMQNPSFPPDETLFDTLTNSIVYATGNKLLFLQPSALKRDLPSNIPVVDRVTINNKDIFTHSPGTEISLEHDENNISLEFTAVNFSSTYNTKLAYQLTGLDTSWKISDANQSVHYANLLPGTYIFKIKTENETGEWSGDYDVFTFTIRPVFWQTTWFQFLVFASLSFLIFWFVRRRIRNIRKEAELKQKLAETEMMALRSQMNPHFIFNCLSAIDNLIQTNQADKATTYLGRFAKLIRSVLESSKNNVVPFHKDFKTLELFLQLEQLRCNNKFEYELLTEGELMDGDYKVPPLIIQPFVENAIHHGLLNKMDGERKLVIKAFLKDNFIQYSIQDTGVGRAMAQEIKDRNKPEHQSYGIQITTERIHLHNKEENKNDDIVITDLVENGRAAGTEINIQLKVY
ncbi:MAG: two-component regulator propeller domain-containing protein [Chitinophagaceae bacterium]